MNSAFQDWEAKVIDFLRRQEKAGGPPTVVAVVLDALGADNLHVERGLEMDRVDVKEMETVDLPERVLWPAVYMRSTLHLDAAAPPHRSHHGKTSMANTDVVRKRASSSKKSLSEWASSQSSSEQSSSRLFGSTSTRNLEVDIHRAKPQNHILEYGPEGAATTTWPHNEWTALVSLLEISPVPEDGILNDPIHIRAGSNDSFLVESFRMAEEPVAVTYRHDTVEPKEGQQQWGPSLERAVRIFGVYANSDMNAVDAHAVREHDKQRSTFHIVSLSKYLSMVVMVKDEEESHFLRRRNPLTDEEIRDFMNGMAAHWNVSRLFSHDRLPAPLSTTRIELLHDEWDNTKIEDLIRRVKTAFGLRPTSYPLTEGHRGISFLGRSSPKRPLRRSRQRSTVEDSHSAAAFFLGPELANLFDI